MLDVYVVSAPSVLEVFLDYGSADDFRNRCIVATYHDVTLLHRKVLSRGDSLEQRRAGYGLADPANAAAQSSDILPVGNDHAGEGTTDVFHLAQDRNDLT